MLGENEAYLNKDQSGAAEAWWAHNPQVPGSKPGSDRSKLILTCLNCSSQIYMKTTWMERFF